MFHFVLVGTSSTTYQKFILDRGSPLSFSLAGSFWAKLFKKQIVLLFCDRPSCICGKSFNVIIFYEVSMTAFKMFI